MCIGLHVDYLLVLSDSNETWIFSRFSKNPQISNLMKTRRVGAEFFQYGRTNRHYEANSRICANASKNVHQYHSAKPGAATWILSALRHSELVEAQISCNVFRYSEVSPYLRVIRSKTCSVAKERFEPSASSLGSRLSACAVCTYLPLFSSPTQAWN
jgi:hypothetical protein